MRTSSQSSRPDDSGNQIGLIGQAEVSTSALGHPFKIRASKLTFEWLFNSKTETLGRLHYTLRKIVISPTFLAFQRHHLHTTSYIQMGRRQRQSPSWLAELPTIYIPRYAMKTKPRYTPIIIIMLYCTVC